MAEAPTSGIIGSPHFGNNRGIYRIYRIEHRFDNGQFTQRLHMQRDALTDLSFITGQRDKKQTIGGGGK